jgi:two-component system response regulator HydG
MAADVKTHIILADAEASLLKSVAHAVKDLGARVTHAGTWEALEELLQKESPALLLIDVKFDARLTPAAVGEILKQHPQLAILLLAAKGAQTAAAPLLDAGAYDVAAKPIDEDRLERHVAMGLQQVHLKKRIANLERLLSGPKGVEALLGHTPAIRRLRDLIQNVAPTSSPLLLEGESGTGKRLIAQLIHNLSGRKGKFVSINLAAVPRELMEGMLFGCEKGSLPGIDHTQAGYLENADGGTAYLSDIGELDLGLQPKLLRLIQEGTLQRVGSAKLRRVNVRIIAGSLRDLGQMIKGQQFREDLYYTLAGVAVKVPPLRDRRDDIALLAIHFAETAAARYRRPFITFSPRALDYFRYFAWPGNVRQLEGMVERLVLTATGPTIADSDLPAELINTNFALEVPTAPPSDTELSKQTTVMKPYEIIEKRAILEALGQTKGHVGRAAQILGYGQATVYRKIKRFGIPLKATYP